MAEALESGVKRSVALLKRLAAEDAIYQLCCSWSLTKAQVTVQYWEYNLSRLTACLQSLKELKADDQEQIAGLFPLDPSSPLLQLQESKVCSSFILESLENLELRLKELLTEIPDDHKIWEQWASLCQWAKESEKSPSARAEDEEQWYEAADLLHDCPEPDDQSTTLRESILEACSKGFYCAAALLTQLTHYDRVLESDIDSGVLAAIDESYAHCFQPYVIPLYNVMKAGTLTKVVQQIYFGPHSKLRAHAAQFYEAVKTPEETLDFLKDCFFIEGDISLETRIQFESFHIFLSELATQEITRWQNKKAISVDHDRDKLMETWGDEELSSYGSLMKKLDYVHRLYQIASQSMLDSFGQSEKILCPEVL